MEQTNVKPQNADAAKVAEAKAKKAEASRKWKENKVAAEKARVEGTKKLIEELKKLGTYDKLSDSAKALLDGIVNPARASSNGGLFEKIFGAAPKVGDKKTLMEIMETTLCGKSKVDHYCKVWAEKGIIVKFVENKTKMTDSTYVIEKL